MRPMSMPVPSDADEVAALAWLDDFLTRNRFLVETAKRMADLDAGNVQSLINDIPDATKRNATAAALSKVAAKAEGAPPRRSVHTPATPPLGLPGGRRASRRAPAATGRALPSHLQPVYSLAMPAHLALK